MVVREQLVLLSELGNLDRKLKALQTKIGALPQKSQAAQTRADALTQQIKALETKHADLLLKRKQSDLELQTERGNQRKWESRAEKIKGEREYAALMSEIGGLKKQIADIENRIIDTMQELEDVEKQMEQARKDLSKALTVAQSEMDEVKDELAELQEEQAVLLNARSALTAKMDKMLVKRYEQIAQRRSGVGVAVVEQEVCQACRRMLPPELFIRVMKFEVIENCPSCQRFLLAKELNVVDSSEFDEKM